MNSKMLQRCSRELDSDDLFTIQHCVEKMVKWIIENKAPDEVRLNFCHLLEIKANQTSNRVIAVYLRSVARNYASHSLDQSR